jgi:hypothetical protein
VTGYREFLPSMRIKTTLALSPDGTMVAYIVGSPCMSVDQLLW